MIEGGIFVHVIKSVSTNLYTKRDTKRAKDWKLHYIFPKQNKLNRHYIRIFINLVVVQTATARVFTERSIRMNSSYTLRDVHLNRQKVCIERDIEYICLNYTYTLKNSTMFALNIYFFKWK